MRTLGTLYFLLLAVLGSAVAETTYVEGDHYQLIPIPVESQQEKATEVVEIFSYGEFQGSKGSPESRLEEPDDDRARN